jgi:F-type H+-transporting ATPase subunit a
MAQLGVRHGRISHCPNHVHSQGQPSAENEAIVFLPEQGNQIMTITPDITIFWQYGPIKLNETIVSTWLIMTILGVLAWWTSRRISPEKPASFWQNILETLVVFVRDIIKNTTNHRVESILIFAGSLFVFVATANILAVIPGFTTPTGSLSTTTALALCVFVAVPWFGISQVGLKTYLANYLRPTWIMFPFNLIGELSRTLALAVRLFGNMMSGTMIGAILLLVIPLIFPVLMQLLGLLTGVIQAYIFAVLAIVYIASGMETQQSTRTDPKT